MSLLYTLCVLCLLFFSQTLLHSASLLLKEERQSPRKHFKSLNFAVFKLIKCQFHRDSPAACPLAIKHNTRTQNSWGVRSLFAGNFANQQLLISPCSNDVIYIYHLSLPPPPNLQRCQGRGCHCVVTAKTWMTQSWGIKKKKKTWITGLLLYILASQRRSFKRWILLVNI